MTKLLNGHELYVLAHNENWEIEHIKRIRGMHICLINSDNEECSGFGDNEEQAWEAAARSYNENGFHLPY